MKFLLALAFLATGAPLIAQTAAQPTLPAISVRIGQVPATLEVADNDDSRSAGLMFRESLETDHGMLFIMPQIAPAGFWMKNTLIPLSIAFLAPDGTILEIHDMEPRSEKITRSRFPQIAFAIEMEQGWFSKNNILPGDRVTGLPRHPATR